MRHWLWPSDPLGRSVQVPAGFLIELLCNFSTMSVSAAASMRTPDREASYREHRAM